MDKLFNTTFEISLRVMLVLNASLEQLSIGKITAFDFIANYGIDFAVSESNLHGNNRMRFSEYATRREIVGQAIKSLVLLGYVAPRYGKDGFSYSLTDEGKLFCQELNDEYATKYSTGMNKVLSQYANNSEVELVNKINQRAITMLGGK